MAYFVYILRSLKNGSYYKGSTDNVLQRLEEHNRRKEKSTSRYAPWKLIWFVEKSNREEAVALELKLKNITSRTRLEAFIEKYSKTAHVS